MPPPLDKMIKPKIVLNVPLRTSEIGFLKAINPIVVIKPIMMDG